MSGCLNLSPYKMSNKNNIVNEEHHSQNPLEKKDIVTILSSDFSNTTTQKISSSLNININNNSIRRTLSADMSSQKWLQNNEFPLKKVPSSEHLQRLGEEHHHKNEEMNDKKGFAFEDIWSSILSEKKPGETGSGDPAPYVHPLVKRASSLSEKSLEICTESLGSETGSDGFSYPASDQGEEEEVDDDGMVVEEEMKNDYVEVAKYNYSVKNKKINSGVVKSFPPPLPSLAHRDDGSNLQMRTRRHDGRLVLEAVSVPSRNCFRARREDGRLLLTLTNDNEDEEQEGFDGHDLEGEMDEVVEGVGENNNVEELALVVEDTTSCLPTTRVINVHTTSPTMIMTKLMELTCTRNMTTWPRASNRTVITSLDEEDEEVLGKQVEVKAAAARQKVVQSRPPRPRVSTATSAADVLNAYEYYWRRSDSPTAAAVAVLKPLAGKQINAAGGGIVSPQVVRDTNRINKLLLAHNLKGAPQEQMVLVKAGAVGGEYLVPIVRGCKEPRRSLFFWEPFCIATS